ncbi:bifunctional transcriptional activator/DNA repair enzyme AdaA [Cognatishimia sp. MH4019]|uniref:bifunctional transcriptional activator/DNA repair enzyme AdaA n=1 Tax=Cognatishimia sp. MH4019 TaxID=2854030 RepID=UPI001CD24982|nr:trifunctional transcriptional activator/DNA repair protein Ada/methylated-DNA--[protein]-cysteine S-methyltransferase [Cognatishimia sp. MH4019]
MLFPLPSDDELYRALLERDPLYDGQAYVAVRSTGIFCRLTCPARKPKRENCQFFENIGACLEAGYRACKRCKPMGPQAKQDPVITRLMEALEAAPDRRWSEGDIVAMGIDPSTARRAFQRQFGMTFLKMARLERLRRGFEAMQGGGRVIDAQLEAGFDSQAGFANAFAKLLGQPPGALSRDPMMRAHWIDTPLGPMIAVADKRALHLLEFADRKALPSELKRLYKDCKCLGIGRFGVHEQVEDELNAYFMGKTARFKVPLALRGNDFTRRVWEALLKIPAGETRSYGDLAKALGQPTATRAVARANGANQIALIVPCHRVIGADGSLTGYGGGLWRKQQLIEIERKYLP